ASRRPVRYVVIACAAVAAIALIVALTTRGSRNQPSPGESAPESRGTGAGTGSERSLFLAGQESVFVALDEEALPQLLGAFAAKENEKVDGLVRSGRVVRVANHTKVQVLEVEAGKVKVRLTEGEHVMQTGWVVDRWVQ